MAVFLSLPWIPSNLLNAKQTYSSLAPHQNVKRLRWQYITRASNTCGGKIKGAWLVSYENLAQVAALLGFSEVDLSRQNMEKCSKNNSQ